MSNTDGRACGVRLRQAGFSAQQAAYAKLFADRYAADNIRMNNVLPGFIDSFPEQQEVRERVPMKRYGRAGRTRRRAVRGWTGALHVRPEFAILILEWHGRSGVPRN